MYAMHWGSGLCKFRREGTTTFMSKRTTSGSRASDEMQVLTVGSESLELLHVFLGNRCWIPVELAHSKPFSSETNKNGGQSEGLCDRQGKPRQCVYGANLWCVVKWGNGGF
jgi:hypothetical protein